MKTSEREEAAERLKQIRERRHAATLPANQRGLLPTASWVDIDFLLSLYDAQASLIEDFRHNRIGDELQRVAEGMRERCAGVVKDFQRLRGDNFWRKYGTEMLITALESLSLEGKKEQ